MSIRIMQRFDAELIASVNAALPTAGSTTKQGIAMGKDNRSRARDMLALYVGLGLGMNAPGAPAANLINNGDFANVGGVFKANTPQGGDDVQTSGGTAIPGWSNVAKSVNELWIEPGNAYGVTASPNNGSGYFVDLTGQGDSKPYGGIAQKITTVTGMGYTLTFALGASTLYNSSGTGAAALTASVTGSSVLASHLFSLAPTSTSQWASESLTFIADSDSTTIEFLGNSDNTSRYIGLDGVAVESRLLPAATTLTASPTTASSGAAVSFTALVKPTPGSVTPAGTVQFKSGTTVLGAATLNGTGQATLSTKSLAVGKNSITALYSGDSIYGTSNSSAVSVTVTASTGPTLSLSATAVVFADQAAETSSAAKTVTMKNTGSASIALTSIALTGSQADDFTLAKTCGSSLAAGASCTLSIAFKPVSTGAKSATVSITDNAGGSPQSIALSGTGTNGSGAATIKLSTTSLAFGKQASGSASAAKTITLSNSGSTALSLTSISLTGGQADDFTLAKSCGSSLAAGASCTLSVIFKPVSAGAKMAAISIADNASGAPQSVALGGTGT